MGKEKRKMIHCPWCSKDAPLTKNKRLGSHVTAGGLRCIGIGAQLNQVKNLNGYREEGNAENNI